MASAADRVVACLPQDVALERLREDIVGDLAFNRRVLAASFSLETMFRPWRLGRHEESRVVVGRVAGRQLWLRRNVSACRIAGHRTFGGGSLAAQMVASWWEHSVGPSRSLSLSGSCSVCSSRRR